MTFNQQLPGPTLRFKQNEEVIINVHNKLDEPTTVHWHGIILPWQMDGVMGVSQEGIPPGATFQYKFKLLQSGTYWYHSHAGMQEQQGLYGAFIIEPEIPPSYHYDQDVVIVLSDWSNTDANEIFNNLKKNGDYYSVYFPLQPSLSKFMHDYESASPKQRKQICSNYSEMQQMRMSIYDLSDVAYDAYLLNGHSNNCPWSKRVNVGDTVRLRFIGAAGSTIFNIKIPSTTMQVVHVQGNDVEPFDVSSFTLAPGETLDVLVKITEQRPYIIYAESRDTLGAAYGALLTAENQQVNYSKVAKFPEPSPVNQTMMTIMMDQTPTNDSHSMPQSINHATMNHSMHMPTHTMPQKTAPPHSMHMSNMNMSAIKMHDEPQIIGTRVTQPSENYLTSQNIFYRKLTASNITNDPNRRADGEIKIELFGYMDRYIWFMNGLPEYLAKPLVLKPNQRYRIVFINNTMMYHPMHIHGHWFILRKGSGEHDPLLHTINVAPGATITVDLDTDASGQWFFHCHLLYHMSAGMAQVVQYSDLPAVTCGQQSPTDIVKNSEYVNRPIVQVDKLRDIPKGIVNHPEGHMQHFWLSNNIDISFDPINNVQELDFTGMYGYDYNKLQLFVNDAELEHGKVSYADMDIFYWHLINQFWAVKGGLNYFYRPAEKPYWQPGIGIEGIMPYFIEPNLRAYYRNGSAKFDLQFERNTQITDRWIIQLGIRSILATKTIERMQVGVGLNEMRYYIGPIYTINPWLSMFMQYEYQHNYGAFKRLQYAQDETSVSNTLSFGLSFMF